MMLSCLPTKRVLSRPIASYRCCCRSAWRASCGCWTWRAQPTRASATSCWRAPRATRSSPSPCSEGSNAAAASSSRRSRSDAGVAGAGARRQQPRRAWRGATRWVGRHAQMWAITLRCGPSRSDVGRHAPMCANDPMTTSICTKGLKNECKQIFHFFSFDPH